MIVARVARNPELRRLELSFAGFSFCEHATWLAVLVYAMERGGAGEVGLVVVVQLVPGVLLAPFAAYGGDRFPAQRTLAVGYVAQAVAMGATAAFMAADAAVATYSAATVAATCVTFTRPAMGALLPAVTHAPRDLVAANVVTGALEHVGEFAGPLAAGAVMVVASPWAVLAGAAGVLSIAAVAVVGVDVVAQSPLADDLDARTVASQAFGGFRTLAADGRLRALVWLGGCAGIVKGIGDVAFVTFAEVRLDASGGTAGVLAAAFGVGALVGAVAVSGRLLTGAARRQFAAGAALSAGSLVAIGASGALSAGVVLFALMGAGATLLQLTSSVAIQRRSPSEVMARVFGVLEGLHQAALAVGSALFAVVASSIAFGAAAGVTAGVVVLAVLVGVVLLGRHGADVEPVDEAVVDRLLADPLFEPLTAPTVERLARVAEWMEVSAGTTVCAEGEPGDRYYLVASGVLDVTILDRFVRELGPGSSLGEIALLRDVPRTATAVARTDTALLSVTRDEFLAAVTRHPRSLGVASEVVDDLLRP